MPVANENLRLLGGAGASELNEPDIARATVKTLIAKSNTVLIGPLFWFILLGPAFALLQRLTSLFDEDWRQPKEDAATRVNAVLAWMPVRITAFSYAVMGSFEDALRCWRSQIRARRDDATTPLLAAGLGAMQLLSCEDMPQTGGEAVGTAVTLAVFETDHVRRTVALLWRVLLFWLGVTLLMLIAGALS